MRDLLASSSQGVWPAPGTVLSTGSDHACACSCSGDASTHSIYQASSWMIIRRWSVSHSLHCVALRVCAKPNAKRAERPELKMTPEGGRLIMSCGVSMPAFCGVVVVVVPPPPGTAASPPAGRPSVHPTHQPTTYPARRRPLYYAAAGPAARSITLNSKWYILYLHNNYIVDAAK